VTTENQNISAYRPWQIKIFIATWLAYAGYYFCRKPFYIAKVSISSEMGLNALDLAQIGTAFLVAYMVGQFSSAFFGGKLGPKLLLLVGMGISITSGVLFGISNSYWTFMLLIGLNGLAQGTGWPGCIGSLAFWFRRKQRGSVLGVWSTCYQLGPIVATVLASFLLGRAGWRWSFFGGSIVLLAIWFIVLVIHPNRPENAGLPPLMEDDEIKESSSAASESRWDRNVIVTIVMMGLIYFCIKFLRYALWSWLPWFLNKNFFMTEANAGYLSIIFDICGFAGVIAGGFISDRLFRGRRALLSFIMLGMMTFSFLILYFFGSNNLPVFTISIGFAGFMLFGPDSLLSGVGAIDVGSKQSALFAAGIINGMGSIGPIFQEQLIGWMYQRYDQSLLPILIMLVFIAVLSALLAYILFVRSKKGLANI
jgi:MFS transporter, OPA family, sugar phosphate sensor protein UhpC